MKEEELAIKKQGLRIKTLKLKDQTLQLLIKINTLKKILLMNNIWKLKIWKQPTVLDQEKYVEIQQLKNFIKDCKVLELIFKNGLIALNYRVLYLEWPHTQ